MAYCRTRLADDPHLWASTLLDELADLGYRGGYSTFTRALRRHQLRPHCEPCQVSRGRDVAIIAHPPGEEAQFDWVELPNPPAAWGVGRHAHLLVGALAYSGRWRGVLADAEDFPHLIEALDSVVRKLGGPTHDWSFDLMATVCYPSTGRLTAAFAQAAKHYGVRSVVCPPRRGNRKGVVEKANHSAAQRWWRTVADDATIAEAQAGVDRLAVKLDDRRRVRDGEPTYDDFGGYDKLKERIYELIELPLRHRDKLLTINAPTTRGVLFTGPSGTGKTMLGRIIAGQAQALLYLISGPEIVGKYLGDSEKLIRDIFDDAEKQERAIIFFDEIDSLAPQRGDDTHEASRRLVGQLLTSMDGYNKRTNVMVIATTNRPEDIDVALRRPGRFDWQVVFTLPDRDDRVDILRKSVREMNVTGDLPHGLIADRTEGWNSAELAAIRSEAALFAIKDDRDVVTVEDYFAGFELVANQRETVVATQKASLTSKESQ